MQSINNIWEVAELWLSGNLSQSEKAAIQVRLDNEAGFEAEFNECLNVLRTLNEGARTQKFRSDLKTIHTQETATTVKKLFTRIVALPHTIYRSAAVAAAVALFTSAFTFWALTPSIKKNDSQYNTISREVEHIKKGLKNNTDAIETIKKNTPETPAAPPSDAKYTGTGFALTNDGYFVTAWHVLNHGNFDSVYILNKDGHYFKASLVRHDDKGDIAILKVEKKNFKFGKSDLPYSIVGNKSAIGARIFTIGYPKDDEVYCEGYISSKNGFEGDDLQYTLQLPVSHGQSGSPVYSESGNVIGILTAVGSQGEANTYAVSTKALKDLIDDTPSLSKLRFQNSNKLHSLKREKQIEKIEDYIFSVQVYKK